MATTILTLTDKDVGIYLVERLWTIAESCRLQQKNVNDYIIRHFMLSDILHRHRH